jgi:hypothetical protein
MTEMLSPGRAAIELVVCITARAVVVIKRAPLLFYARHHDKIVD